MFEFDRRLPDFIGDLTLTRPRCTLDRRVQPNSRKLLHFGIPSYLFIFKKSCGFWILWFLWFLWYLWFLWRPHFSGQFFFSKVLWHVCGDHKTAKTTLQSNLLFQDWKSVIYRENHKNHRTTKESKLCKSTRQKIFCVIFYKGFWKKKFRLNGFFVECRPNKSVLFRV